MSFKTHEFQNNSAIFGWAFMLVWIAMLAVFTWLYIDEAGFNQFRPGAELTIIAVFWLFGIGFSAFFFSAPLLRLSLANGHAVLCERWLWRSREESFPASALARPVLSEVTDSEGDPYYLCTIMTPSGRTIAISEHQHRPDVEAARDRFLAVIG